MGHCDTSSSESVLEGHRGCPLVSIYYTPKTAGSFVYIVTVIDSNALDRITKKVLLFPSYGKGIGDSKGGMTFPRSQSWYVIESLLPPGL